VAYCEKCKKEYLTRECLRCRDNLKNNINYKNKKHANFLIRALASIIDSIIISLPIILIFGDYVSDILAGTIIILLWIFWQGQTPGKKVLNLKIVDENYSDIDTKTAIIRYAGYYLSLLTFFMGFTIIAFREDKRGLHDILAKTYVIHTDKEKTDYESDTADKIFAIIATFAITILIFIGFAMYQETKALNEMMYGTNDEKIIKQKKRQTIEQNEAMIDEINRANKEMTKAFQSINKNLFNAYQK